MARNIIFNVFITFQIKDQVYNILGKDDFRNKHPYALSTRLVVIYNVGLSLDLPADCRLEVTSVSCIRSLPNVLPENVFKVTVQDFTENRIDNDTFVDRSWSSVLYLDITVRHKVALRLQNYNFLSDKRNNAWNPCPRYDP